MNKRMKILLVAGAVMVLLLAAGYLKQQDKNADGSVNSVSTIETAVGDKTYYSKKSAYEAYANEKENFYNRPIKAIEVSANNREPAVPEPAVTPKKTSPVTRTSQNSSDEQFDAAYNEIQQNVQSIYEDSPSMSQPPYHKEDSQNEVVESDVDRRRKAMMRDWGMGQTPKSEQSSSASSMFRAVIHGTQLVKTGQTALFRTKEPIRYGSLLVPANTLLSGVTSISENRLTIRINSVRMGREVFSLPLAVYGSDGILGIPLNYDEVGQITNSQASSTAISEASSAVSRYGGTVGRVVGSVISGVGSQVRSAKNVEVKLIDNQIIILKIEEK